MQTQHEHVNLQIFYSCKILALPAVLAVLPSCDILVTALDTLHLEQQYAVVSKKLGVLPILLNSEFEALISATPQWTNNFFFDVVATL